MTTRADAGAKQERAPETTIRSLLDERQAKRMVARGEIDITQRGRLVDPDDVRGPIRLRLRERPPLKGRS